MANDLSKQDSLTFPGFSWPNFTDFPELLFYYANHLKNPHDKEWHNPDVDFPHDHKEKVRKETPISTRKSNEKLVVLRSPE